MDEFYERALVVYEEVRDLSEGVEAFMKEADRDPKFMRWLAERGSAGLFHELRMRTRRDAPVRSLSIPASEVAQIRERTISSVRQQAIERGRQVASAPNRTARLTTLFDTYKIYDNTPLGDCTRPQAKEQYEIYRRAERGNARGRKLWWQIYSGWRPGATRLRDWSAPAEIKKLMDKYAEE